MHTESVSLKLSSEEALVLFDLLTRFEQSDRLAIEHSGETAALWGLLAALERELVDPFRSNYSDLVSDARDRLVKQNRT